MAEFIEIYRGHEIWFYEAGEVTPSEVYGSKGGICKCTGYFKSLKACKKNIDYQYDKTPHYIEDYLNIPIYYAQYQNGNCNVYWAKVGIQTKYFPNKDLDGCREWIAKMLENDDNGNNDNGVNGIDNKLLYAVIIGGIALLWLGVD